MEMQDVTIQIIEIDESTDIGTPAQAVVEVTVEDGATGLKGSCTIVLDLLDPEPLFQAIAEAKAELEQQGPFAKGVETFRTIVKLGSVESFTFRGGPGEDLDRFVEWLNSVSREKSEE